MSRRLTVVFSPAESLALDRLAQQDTRHVKDEVRALIRTEAERRCLWFDDPASAEWRGHSAAELGRPVEDL